MAEHKGFIKTSTQTPAKPQPVLPAQQKVQLIRRGNELFNAGKLDLAEKIFVTLGYSDGIIRVGDSYVEKGDFVRAVKLYKLAPDPGRVEKICKRMAGVIRQLMIETPKDKLVVTRILSARPQGGNV